MSDWYIVRDDSSEADMRRLHLLQAGKQIDINEVMGKYEIKPGTVAAVLHYEEKETGMWHMRLYWRPDERNETVEV